MTNKQIVLTTNTGVEKNQEKVAELFNSHFIEAVDELIEQNKHSQSTQKNQIAIKYCADSMAMLPITEQEVECEIRNLKGKSSAGYDEIPEHIIKKCAIFLKAPLTYVYNISINSGVFPKSFKVAKIKPLLKKGDSHDVKNYRPIAILSVFSKIFEKIMHNRLLGFLNKHNTLSQAQNGFRQQKSTTTAIQSFIANIRQALGEGYIPVGIFFDLSKAYDVLNHGVLLDKLWTYGIRGIIHSWFVSYLSERKQFVEINCCNTMDPSKHNCTSSSRSLKYGVPQGSVLGPLLFLLYINDLPLVIDDGKLVLFADDINLLLIGKNEKELQHKVKVAMEKMEKWFHINNLMINIEKTVAMTYRTVQKNTPVKPQIMYNGREVAYKSSTKFLGVHIEETLRWVTHIHTLRNQLSRTCYLINSVQGQMGFNMMKCLYHAKFESLSRYGIIFWGVERESILIFRQQKRVIRAMCGVGRDTSCKKLFKECGLLTITSLYILEVLCFMRRYKLEPQKNEQIHEHNTRGKQQLHIKPCKINLQKKSVINMGIRLYNKLPKNIQREERYNSYKRKMREFLIDNAFYSLDEYFKYEDN